MADRIEGSDSTRQVQVTYRGYNLSGTMETDNTITSLTNLLACPDCDLLLKRIDVKPGDVSLCPRCGRNLDTPKHDSIDKTLALAISGLILFIPANFMSIMSLNILGMKGSGSVYDSIIAFIDSGYFFVAMIAGLTCLIFPFVKLGLLFTLSLCLKIKKYPACLKDLMRWYHHLDEWGMLEVFMLGILISIIKLHHMAHIHYDPGFFCFIGLLIVALSSSSAMDDDLFWELIEKTEPGTPDSQEELMAIATGKRMAAREAGLAVCHDCHKLIDFRNIPASALSCPRCGATVHTRHPGSLNKTWALVITAVILAFPANLLPIMSVEYLGQEDLSTIMDGIVYFFQSGSYGIGAVIFTASILVPCFKMIGIVLILLSIHFRWRSWLRHKTVMFRFIQFIGRWSMLDIFVIALMQVLVTFGSLSTSGAGPAATFFTGVVLATMFAAITFDTRLLWDV